MNTEEAIRREALATLSRRGVEGLSLREVARGVGVTAPAVYRHFDSKAHLVRVVVRSAREEAADFLRECLQGAEGPAARLRALLQGWVELAERRPGIYDTLASEPPDRATQRFPEEFCDDPPPAFELAGKVVEECMNAGVLRRDDPLWTTLVLWSQLHGLVGLHRAGYFGDDGIAEVVEEVMERLDRGVGP